jgi:hypothetical protein
MALMNIVVLDGHMTLNSEATRAAEWSRSADLSFCKKPLFELAGRTIGIIYN